MERILAHIDDHFDAHLDQARRFVRQPSISGEGIGMPEMARLVADRITELGGRAEIVPTDGWPVVYGEIDQGAPRTLLVYGMYDVQPVEGETWMAPPFEGQVVSLEGHGPSMVARGVYNTKGPLAGFFNVVHTLREVEGRLPVNLKFMIEGEEELGSVHLPQFVARHRDRLRADAAYFPFYMENAQGKPVMWLGVKGILFFELTCRGGDWGGPTVRGIHGSNAVWISSPTWRLVQALRTMVGPDERILVDGLYDGVAPVSADDEELLAALARTFDEQTILQDHDVKRFKYDLRGVDLLRRYLYDPTLNIDGLVSGYVGAATKTLLPHEARAKMDVRMVPNMEPETVVATLRAHLDRHGYADIELRVNEGYPPAKTSVRQPVVQALIRAVRRLGVEPEIWPHLGGSAPFYLFTGELRLPFAMGGLGHGGRPHSPNEYATVEGMKRFEKSVAAFLVEFARG
ncbi:MAG: M20/M25/M40 family metallo-hydrolase [Armatimonadetes bacterium]|nr:M20/M25/M40 family metallo-hydrolase [Armatimonadota bacterium]